ncbi:MAG: hypothetical protein GY720_20895 [bacterium]|nr:hypothetical protein [bacterium]
MSYRQIPAEEWDEQGAPDFVSERLQQLSSDDVEKILERAISLQMDSADPSRDSIDPEALGRIADELGIDRSHLRRAMVEELARIDEEDPGWLSRNLMPNKIAESRTVAASPDRVRAVLDYWLGSQEGLRKHSSNVEGATWTRDGSPLTAIRTAFNMTQGDGSLRSVRAVTDTIKPLTVGNQVVSVEADTSNLRQLAIGLLIGSGVLGAAAMGISAGIDPGGFGAENVAAGIGVAAVAGGGVWLGFRMWGQKLRRGVARVADAVAHPHLVKVAESVPKRLARFVDQIRTIGEEFRR